MENNSKEGVLKRTLKALGFVDEGVSEKRGAPLEVIYGPASAPSSNRSDSTVVTPGDAMSLVGVYRAVSILATATEQLPLGVWRRGVEIDTPLIIKQPSMDYNRSVVIEQTVMSMALTGNAYWRLVRNSPDEPVVAIEVLNPHQVHIETDERLKVTGYTYGDKSYKPWQVKHLSLLRVPGSHYGLGPIQAAQATLRGAYDVRDYAANWFNSSGVPNGILKTDTVLDSEMAAQYKERFEATQSSGRGVAVLGNGLNYQAVYLSPADAQFIETQQWNKNEVATLFGIPALYLLADAGNNTSYSNQQQVDIAFLKFGLSQYLIEIEQAFTDLLPRGQDARFVTEGLLRTDTKSRYEAHAIGITNKWLLPNEVRAIEGLAPIEGGDEFAEPPAPVEPVAPNETNEEVSE